MLVDSTDKLGLTDYTIATVPRFILAIAESFPKFIGFVSYRRV
jgi:hypothetical protein